MNYPTSLEMDESDPKYDRLKLTQERLEGIAGDMKNVANLKSPVGEVLEERDLESGLHLKKVRVPLGVIAVIYEARPNVTFDVFALTFKSGNACVLKGGSDAKDSNEAIVNVIHQVLNKHQIDTNILKLFSSREAAKFIMEADEFIDVIIPRGSQRLIDAVKENARVPVIETGAGIVHTYVDESADLEMAKNIIFNEKTRRVSVCNALDTLVIHESLVNKLPELVAPMADQNVEIFADEKAFEKLKDHYPKLQKATDEHFGTEFLDYKMSIKTVANIDEALDHISKYSSQHSEAIVSKDQDNIERFLNEVDASAVYANTSTCFSDGAQFGMGAEIGISTQKLHARGPMALPELTSYKWIVRGEGQVRN